MTTRARTNPRTTIERAAARQATEIRSRLGQELRTAREDAGVSLSRLADICGMSKGQLHRIEAGTTQPGWEILARLCTALGRRLGLTLYPDGNPLIRDHIQAAMLSALLAIVHERWRPRPEVAVYRPVRGVIDLVLDASDEPTVACEAQSEMHRIEQQVRWSRAKADALSVAHQQGGDGTPARPVGRLLLLRSTTRNRAIAAQYGELLSAAYPAHAQDAYEALAGGAPWPGDSLLWCRVGGGHARILERPPRGIRSGR